MTDSSAQAIAAELDAAHQRAHRAFAARDLEAYMAGFSPTLVYYQLNGAAISREQLRRHVRLQFARLDSAVSTYRRERLEVVGDEVRELIEQRVEGLVTAFVIVHRRWDLKRRGLYRWQKGGQGWQITEVTVLEEQATSSFSLGLHPPRPAGASDSAA